MNKKNLAKFVHNYDVEKGEEVLATNISYFYVIQNIPQGGWKTPPPSSNRDRLKLLRRSQRCFEFSISNQSPNLKNLRRG